MGQHGPFVGGLLLQERHHSFHTVFQLPVELRETSLCLQNFLTDARPLVIIQIDPPLVLEDELRWKHELR